MNPEIIKNEVEIFLKMMNIPFKEISINIDTDLHLTIISLRVSGTEQELFVENFSELTRSFGTLLKLFLETKHHYYKDIVIDINGENRKFINQAKQKAEIAVERVRFFEKPYEFGYLNSYERMLIHSYLKNIPDIVTESTGVGKDRRLVIKKEAN